MTAQMVIGAVLGLPALLWTGLPAAAALPWIAGSTCINLVIVTALLRAYALLGFGTAYPMVRALSVMLVTPAAALLSGELLSGYGLLGIGLIVVSLLLLAAGDRGHATSAARGAWSGCCSGRPRRPPSYVLCDAQGVRRAGLAACLRLRGLGDQCGGDVRFPGRRRPAMARRRQRTRASRCRSRSPRRHRTC